MNEPSRTNRGSRPANDSRAATLFYQRVPKEREGQTYDVLLRWHRSRLDALLEDLDRAEDALDGVLEEGVLAHPHVEAFAYHSVGWGDAPRLRGWRTASRGRRPVHIPDALPLPGEPEDLGQRDDGLTVNGLRAVVGKEEGVLAVWWEAGIDRAAGIRHIAQATRTTLRRLRDKLAIYDADGTEQRELLQEAAREVLQLIRRDAKLLQMSYLPASELLNPDYVPGTLRDELAFTVEQAVAAELSDEDAEVRRDILRQLDEI